MTDFGDIREAVQTRQEHLLRLRLFTYNDKVPSQEVLRYVVDSWGWCPANRWHGGNGWSEHLLGCHRYQSKERVKAYIVIGMERHQVLNLEHSENKIQEKLAIIRQKAFDDEWLPWAEQQAYREDEFKEATIKLRHCITSHQNFTYRDIAADRAMSLVGYAHSRLQIQRALKVILARSMKQMFELSMPKALSGTCSRDVERWLLGGWP